jgi:hypothetical protein
LAARDNYADRLSPFHRASLKKRRIRKRWQAVRRSARAAGDDFASGPAAGVPGGIVAFLFLEGFLECGEASPHPIF